MIDYNKKIRKDLSHEKDGFDVERERQMAKIRYDKRRKCKFCGQKLHDTKIYHERCLAAITRLNS